MTKGHLPFDYSDLSNIFLEQAKYDKGLKK